MRSAQSTLSFAQLAIRLPQTAQEVPMWGPVRAERSPLRPVGFQTPTATRGWSGTAASIGRIRPAHAVPRPARRCTRGWTASLKKTLPVLRETGPGRRGLVTGRGVRADEPTERNHAMSRFAAPITALSRPLPNAVAYWLFACLGTIVFAAGLVMRDPYIFSAGLASLVTTELWMIRKTIEAQAAKD